MRPSHWQPEVQRHTSKKRHLYEGKNISGQQNFLIICELSWHFPSACYHLFIDLFMQSQTLIKPQLYARDFVGLGLRVGYKVTGRGWIRAARAPVWEAEHLSASPLLGYVILSRSLNLFWSEIPHPKNQNNIRIYFEGLL